MTVFFLNPPFKTEYGRFSRESRSPCVSHSGALYYPLWLIYAAAVAEKRGFAIEFFDACAERADEKATLEYVKTRVSDGCLFVLDTSTPSIYSDAAFASLIKCTYPDSFILLVGTHPTATVKETMELNRCIDGIARREYDYTVCELASALQNGVPLCSVKGLSYRAEDGSVINNPDAEYITDLDEIPFASEFINRRLSVKNYVFPASAYPEVQLFTGRGCPCRCNFCVYPQTMHGHAYRLRSVENVVAEFRYITENMKSVKQIVIEDDTFTADRKRTVEICRRLIEEKIKIRWLCNARVNLDYETMVIMKAAGCRLIIPGVESASQHILNNIKKGTTPEQTEAYMKNAKRAGLKVHACYMVGNPGETRQTMNDTLAAALRYDTDTAQFFPLIPYPGTEAYEWAKACGYLKGDYSSWCRKDGTLNSVVSTPELSAQELVDFCDYARRKYYLRASYFGRRIVSGLADGEDLKRSVKAFGMLRRFI